MIPMRAEDIRVGDQCEEGYVDMVGDDYESGFTYVHYAGIPWRRLCHHETVNLETPRELA